MTRVCVGTVMAAACVMLIVPVWPGLASTRASAHGQATVLNRVRIAHVLSALGPKPPTNKEVIRGEHYSVKVAMLDHRSGPAEFNEREDRIFIVLNGAGAVCVADHFGAKANAMEALAGCRRLPMRAGSLITVPRRTAYRMQAPRSKVEFLVVRVMS